MTQAMRTQVRCPNCGQPFAAAIEQIIDGGRDPNAKARLLSGRTNAVTCPNCGQEFKLAAPLLYHDAGKDLLIIYVPMELRLPPQEQERVIGSMTNAIVNSLPQDQRRGYLLVPKTALTPQGMIELILEKDGVTKEMIDARRNKLKTAEDFLQADPEDWATMAKEREAEIDEEFFGMLTASAEAAMQNGRPDVGDRLLMLREQLFQLTEVGKALLAQSQEEEALIQEVAGDLNKLGPSPQRENFVEIAVRYAHEAGELAQAKLQILVGLARVVMDYPFFTALGKLIEAATDDAEKELLESTRDQLLEYVGQIDKQSEAVMQQSVSVLQAIINSEDPEATIRANIDLIDDTFLTVLTGNIQNAQQTGNLMASSKLKEVYEQVMAVLQESAPPALRFINEVMGLPDVEAMRAAVNEHAAEFGPELLQMTDVLMQELMARGNNPTLERLVKLRELVENALNLGAPSGNIIKLDPNASATGLTGSRIKRDRGNADSEQEQGGVIIPFSARKRSTKRED